jgi:hypothetical protein
MVFMKIQGLLALIVCLLLGAVLLAASDKKTGSGQVSTIKFSVLKDDKDDQVLGRNAAGLGSRATSGLSQSKHY